MYNQLQSTKEYDFSQLQNGLFEMLIEADETGELISGQVADIRVQVYRTMWDDQPEAYWMTDGQEFVQTFDFDEAVRALCAALDVVIPE